MKRYSLTVDAHGAEMVESKDGAWTRYDEAMRLVAQSDQAVAGLADAYARLWHALCDAGLPDAAATELTKHAMSEALSRRTDEQRERQG